MLPIRQGKIGQVSLDLLEDKMVGGRSRDFPPRLVVEKESEVGEK